MEPLPLLLVHAAATWFLMGLSWTIGAVHYPLFAQVGQVEFSEYHRQHVRRITPVVLPAMALELLSALALAVAPPASLGAGAARFGLVLVAAVWALTALGAVPLHGRLESGFCPRAHRRLVYVHHVRTSLWTLRAGLAALFLWTHGHG